MNNAIPVAFGRGHLAWRPPREADVTVLRKACRRFQVNAPASTWTATRRNSRAR